MKVVAVLLALSLGVIAIAQESPVNLEDWQNLTDHDRNRIASDWTPYNTSEVEPLLNDILEAFRKEHPDYDIRGLGNVFGSLMLVVFRPFIFDKKDAPTSFMGLSIRYTLKEPVPEDFEIYKEYVWAPENYLAFVQSHPAEIRLALKKPSMSEEDMLDALVGMAFDDWIKQCQEWENTGMSPGQRTLPTKAWWKFW